MVFDSLRALFLMEGKLLEPLLSGTPSLRRMCCCLFRGLLWVGTDLASFRPSRWTTRCRSLTLPRNSARSSTTLMRLSIYPKDPSIQEVLRSLRSLLPQANSTRRVVPAHGHAKNHVWPRATCKGFSAGAKVATIVWNSCSYDHRLQQYHDPSLFNAPATRFLAKHSQGKSRRGGKRMKRKGDSKLKLDDTGRIARNGTPTDGSLEPLSPKASVVSLVTSSVGFTLVVG